LEVNGRPSVFSNKSLDDLKRTATLRDLGQNSFTEVQLMDALAKQIVAEQKAARCTSSSDESSDEREIENIFPHKVVSDRTIRRYMDKVCPDAVESAQGSDERRHEATMDPRCSISFALVSVHLVPWMIY
jgi:hypothetical protein